MVDFLVISTRSTKRGIIEIYPKFIIKKSEDLMIRGGDFYAIWIEERGLWSTDEQDALQLIDRELDRYAKENRQRFDTDIKVLHMWDAESGMIDSWHKYCQKQLRDSFHMLDEKLIFSNTATNKKDYASKKLSYPLEAGNYAAYDNLMSVLYSEEERHKIEWAIGSVVSGDSKKIQKFMVLYGAAGTGKSTVLNIIQQLFDGYYTVFSAKALGSSSNAFALEAFKSNPLVAIEHDGDLSRIEDNTRLNSLVSHEKMTVNEKFKSTYANSFKCFLFMGTNKPVKITDAKSGLIRRLIDVSPTGNKLSQREYRSAVKQIGFELGAIAYHCQEVYLDDPSRYDDYVPISMLGASNDFYNYIIDSYHIFKKEDGTTLKAAWEMYKNYCEEAKVLYPLSQRAFKEELKNYFKSYDERINLDDGTRVRKLYSGFRSDKFEPPKNPEGNNRKTKSDSKSWLVFQEVQQGNPSHFDILCKNCKAQYANAKETPTKKWESVKSKLSDLDTAKLHYVKVPENHIVIDFDIPDQDGNKSFEKNLEAASKWPPTYGELSKSGAGIHLHYIYSGDPKQLGRIFDDHIEVKVFTGNSSLRRKLSKCNDKPIATISSGLPLKGEKKVVNFEAVKSEKGLRSLVKRNLRKEIHPGTKPSIDFIYKILEDAYASGLEYDISDMRAEVLAFAANSTHNSSYCIKMVNKMMFKSFEPSEPVRNEDAALIFYDVEVFPNLFLVNWKFEGEEKPVVRMINPTPSEIEELMRYRLVGFNCRRYDNHMLYARLVGYDNEQLFHLSQKIVGAKKGANKDCFFGEAYNVSYTDVYDFAAKKQSLKKWEIELGIHHQELGLPWDEPVPEDMWFKVAEYCDNDVIATEAVFRHLQGDWTARQILADLAGMSVNDTTNTLTTRIIFGTERKPALVYTDLATGKQEGLFECEDGLMRYEHKNENNAFPGYEFVDGKNMYRGTDLGKGGYIVSNPGIYEHVALLDVASLHPHSIIAMNCFGEYTQHFKDILDARIAIKHGDYDTARSMLGGKLAPYLQDESTAKDLAQALKIAINSVYGLTAANFDNPFRDVRNKNNIVALRGALFMRTLQDEVESRGFQIVAIKTDSIKIANATKEIVDFCMEFAKEYSYTFEHEATYDRICQVNDADYIARYANADWCENLYGYVPGDNQKHSGEWTATGAKFQVPYIFKTLFSKEPIEFEDLCETKEVKSAIYLDMNENLPDVSEYEQEFSKAESDYKKGLLSDLTFEQLCAEIRPYIEQGHDYRFIGKVGRFCPIKPGCGGGVLLRTQNDKYYAVTGTSGFRWMESEMVKELNKENDIDRTYYDKLVTDAIEAISKHGDFEQFASDDHVMEELGANDADIDCATTLAPPCGEMKCKTCFECPFFHEKQSRVSCSRGYDISKIITKREFINPPEDEEEYLPFN